MYIKQIRIQKIRSIKDLFWEADDEKEAGWHVVIGDNGSGKSTFLRSVALAIVGPSEAIALRQDWNDWLRKGESQGSIRLDLIHDPDVDKLSGKGKVDIIVELLRQDQEVKLVNSKPKGYIWGGKSGWFSVSYGPFRRFTGGDKDYEKIFYSNPRLAAHLSVFGENVALSECLRWLQELQFKKLERHPDGNLLDSIKEFVNQEGFLPHQAKLHSVSSIGVEFVDGNGYNLPVEELSDGYRSILSMTFEIIRQLKRAYPQNQIFSNDYAKVIVPGVVLIDEVDAHLHPTWQRRVGFWFREHFPNIQFIVTTHSPLICHAATEGSVYRLPKPGSDEAGAKVSGIDLDRLVYGNVLDAYSTEMFGENITRSDESKRLLLRLAELNRKELQSKLTHKEREEQKHLRATLPTSAHIVNDRS